MITVGQVALLAAFIGSGFAAFACLVGRPDEHPRLARLGRWSGVAGIFGLTLVLGILAFALVTKDFRFDYVEQYSSRLLPWHFSLAALWVGQAGSLLLWAWFSGLVALAFLYSARAGRVASATPVFGILMAGLCFLTGMMIFGADPLEPSAGPHVDGEGLAAVLQHPAMLAHPPIVFLGYAAWSVPFALALAALMRGDLKNADLRALRGWSLFAWGILGAGIVIGAQWAYEVLGWGGYWAWDPVENGSLVPWLVGAAFIHALLVWQCRGALKKTALVLVIATFALCNLAAFITRSGIFSSLHAFSQSPIGWMFLAWMAVMGVAGAWLVAWRRGALAPERVLSTVWSREGLAVFSILAFLLVAAAALAGAVSGPVTEILVGRAITPGLAFYNNVLIPAGLVLLSLIAITPLVRWGRGPTLQQQGLLWLAAGTGGGAAVLAFALGVRHPVGLAVAAVAAMAAVSLVSALLLDALLRKPDRIVPSLLALVRARRRSYGGYLVHLGIVAMAVGIAGSSLGSRREETALRRGQSVEWAGRTIRFVELVQQNLPDKIVVQAKLEITTPSHPAYALLPAQHFDLRSKQWRAEAAIHSDWSSDFYVILHSGDAQSQIDLSLIENPLMRWIWFGGGLSACGLALCLWPSPRRAAQQADLRLLPFPQPAALPRRAAA